jgi:hypothetical protein
MKHLFLIATLLFSLSSSADSTFLAGLNFIQVYKETGNEQYELISTKGISVGDFMNTIQDNTTPLGEKVALINALAAYYEWIENPAGSFKLYQDAFYTYLRKNYNGDYSFDNESISPEIRLIWVLMTDFGTSSPNVKTYQMLAKKMPASLTAQSIVVLAYAYTILYNDLNDTKTIQDLKQNYLKPYFENLNRFDLDVPIEVKVLCVDDLLLYTLDCENRLKCFVDTSSEEVIISGLNELSDSIKKNIQNGIPISNDTYNSNWINYKEITTEWITLQEKNIIKINASDVQKAEMRFFFINQVYKLMHNIDYFTILIYNSSYITSLKKTKSNCKTNAICAANNYLKNTVLDLENNGVSKKNIELLTSVKDRFKIAYKNESDIGVIFGFADDEGKYNFSSNFDAIHFLMFYLYIHPEKITQMYDLN